MGGAIGSAFARYEWPFDDARSRLDEGEFGTLRGRDRLWSSVDPR